MLRSEQVLVSALLNGDDPLTLPTYQRDYTWEREHIEALLDDLDNAIDMAKAHSRTLHYFLGNIILLTDAAADGVLRTFIIDGQQRIISLTLIAAALRDFLKDRAIAQRLNALIKLGAAGPAKMRIDLRNATDDMLLKTYVQRPGGLIELIAANTQSRSETALSLMHNRSIVQKRVQAMTDRERRELALFLIDNCQVIVSRTEDVDAAFQIYLTLNNRGKRLATEDILHGELIGPLAETERQKYADILESFGKYRRNLQVIPKSTRKTFFSHLVGTLGDNNDEVIKPIRRAMRAAGGAHAFAETVFRPMADAYRIVMPRSTERGSLSPRAQVALTNLDWFEAHATDDYIAAAMLAVTVFPHTSDDLADVLEKIDWTSHTLAACALGRKHRREAYAKIARLLRDYRDGNASAAAVHAVEPLSQSTVNKALVNVGRKMMEIDKTVCRLILVRIDAQLSGRSLSAYDAFLDILPDDPNALTVEHIVPKGNTIKAEYAEDWVEFSDQRARLAIAQHLGNLALLGRAENTECDQKGFKTKQHILFGSDRRKTHFFATTQELATLEDFRDQDLQARHARFQAAVDAVWGWGVTGATTGRKTVASVPAPKPKKGKAKAKR